MFVHKQYLAPMNGKTRSSYFMLTSVLMFDLFFITVHARSTFGDECFQIHFIARIAVRKLLYFCMHPSSWILHDVHVFVCTMTSKHCRVSGNRVCHHSTRTSAAQQVLLHGVCLAALNSDRTMNSGCWREQISSSPRQRTAADSLWNERLMLSEKAINYHVTQSSKTYYHRVKSWCPAVRCAGIRFLNALPYIP